MEMVATSRRLFATCLADLPKVRDVLVCLILVCLFLSTGTILAGGLEDVPPGHWMYGELRLLSELDIIDLGPAGTDASYALSRYEIAMTLRDVLQKLAVQDLSSFKVDDHSGLEEEASGDVLQPQAPQEPAQRLAGRLQGSGVVPEMESGAALRAAQGILQLCDELWQELTVLGYTYLKQDAAGTAVAGLMSMKSEAPGGLELPVTIFTDTNRTEHHTNAVDLDVLMGAELPTGLEGLSLVAESEGRGENGVLHFKASINPGYRHSDGSPPKTRADLSIDYQFSESTRIGASYSLVDFWEDLRLDVPKEYQAAAELMLRF